MKILSAAVLLLSLSACSSKFSEWPEAKAGMKASEPLIEAVKAYHAQAGKYPSSLDELKLSETVMAELDQHRIHYLTQKKQSQYGVVFRIEGILFKPHCSYGNHTEAWRCSGK